MAVRADNNLRGPGMAPRIFAVFILLSFWGPVTSFAATNDPLSVVKDTTDQVLATLRAQREQIKKDPKHVYSIIEKQILPKIDFSRMSRWVLGKYWRKASKQQKEIFAKEFRRLIVRTYATALLEYNGQQITYPALHMKEGATDVTVQTIIDQPGGVPIPVAYSLHKNGDKQWKVYDMIIDGISLITNYRSSFASEIRRGSLQQLIDKLIVHNK
ncbi:MAG: ABC transporter substrate-binding protein [Gammaproteobacteria bacterium]|nr:MAG: ABC transporter substrate-binding protein [Gammaproteobacteria bacterium]